MLLLCAHFVPMNNDPAQLIAEIDKSSAALLQARREHTAEIGKRLRWLRDTRAKLSALIAGEPIDAATILTPKILRLVYHPCHSI